MVAERGIVKSTAQAHADGIMPQSAYRDWTAMVGTGMNTPEEQQTVLKQWIQQADGILKTLTGGPEDRINAIYHQLQVLGHAIENDVDEAKQEMSQEIQKKAQETMDAMKKAEEAAAASAGAGDHPPD